MTDFEVGDLVRWVKYPQYGVGTVVDLTPGAWVGSGSIRVRFGSQVHDYDDTDGLGYHEPRVTDLELVETDLGRTAREYKASVQEKPLLTGDELVALFEEGEPESDLEKVADQFIAAGKITGSAPIRTHVVEDDVNSPAHYNSGKIEVWDFIYDQGLGYALGNATKYVTRAGKKAGNSKVKDLRKAIAFLEREIKFEETGE